MLFIYIAFKKYAKTFMFGICNYEIHLRGGVHVGKNPGERTLLSSKHHFAK